MTPTFKRADPAGRAFRRPPYPTESGSPLCPLASRRAPHRAIVRIYLDGNETPVVAGLFQDIFNGTGLFPPPFAHKSLSSAVSYFPLPFAEGLKISLDEEPFFYNISARLYEPGTKVVSFSPELMASLSREITEAGDRLTGTVPNMSDTIGGDLQLSPGCQETIPLPDGPQAITSLRVTMDSMEPAALRGSVLRIIFDDEETVFCPLGEFFGSGPGLHPFETLTRSMDPDGSMHCSWVMPYQKHATVAILNLDSTARLYKLRIGTMPYTWDERSRYLHATWRYTAPLPTRPMSDWNYLTVQGKGHYVGDTLTLHNPVEVWWGEGDEKIWVDDDRFPSIFGTGTEDYYGYSWGGQNRAFYEHPMHAQVRVDKYDRHWRGPIPEARDTQGISTELRNLVLDSVTFEKMLKYDMEVWHWEECEMAYAAACFWYGAVGATSNIDRIRIGGTHGRHQPLLGDGAADLVVIGLVAEVAGHAAAAAGDDLDVIARSLQNGHGHLIADQRLVVPLAVKQGLAGVRPSLDPVVSISLLSIQFDVNATIHVQYDPVHYPNRSVAARWSRVWRLASRSRSLAYPPPTTQATGMLRSAHAART